MEQFDTARLNRAIQKFPLEDWLVQHGASKIQQYEWQMVCPVCGKEKLIVSIRKRAWHCWTCEGAHEGGVLGRGGLLSLMRLVDRVDKQAAVNAVLQGSRDVFDIKALHGDLALSFQELVSGHSPVQLPAECRPAYLDYGGRLPYAQRRGITERDCYDFRLFWAPTGRYANRLFFPVVEGGILVYWQARAMWDEHEHRGTDKYVKSLNPPKLDESAAGSADVLMNLDRASAFDRVVITEGPIDCIHVGPEAVCTFGKRLSPAQTGKLVTAGVTAVDLMWDGPGPTERLGAWPEMWVTAKRLSGLFDIRLVFLPQGDPGDYSREQLAWFRQHNSRRPSDAKHRLMEV